MRLATKIQAQTIDRLSQSQDHLSGEALMESAGTWMASEVLLRTRKICSSSCLWVLCGPGNNGGDALVVARQLIVQYRFSKVVVFLTAPEGEGSELNILQQKRLRAHGVQFQILQNETQIEALANENKPDVVIDGLFGIGLDREIKGHYKTLIQLVNRLTAFTIALDIASGVSADQGCIFGVAVNADVTLCVSPMAPGQWVGEGATHSGELCALNIGFAKARVRKEAGSHFLMTRHLAAHFLPRRKNSGNKSSYGKLLIAAGQPGTLGAARLCIEAALRMGVGYVTLTNEKPELILSDWPEVLTQDMDSVDFAKYDAIVVGPGFGQGERQKKFVERLCESEAQKVLIDADAISLIANTHQRPLNPQWVMTPHAGELSRLIDRNSASIEAHRFESVKEAHLKWGCQILLKGYRSILARGRGRFTIIGSGNAALAKAGTGDVLSGFIGGLMAQNRSTAAASCVGAYVHGYIADEWVRQGLDAASFTPSDLLSRVSAALSDLKQREPFL